MLKVHSPAAIPLRLSLRIHRLVVRKELLTASPQPSLPRAASAGLATAWVEVDNGTRQSDHRCSDITPH